MITTATAPAIEQQHFKAPIYYQVSTIDPFQSLPISMEFTKYSTLSDSTKSAQFIQTASLFVEAISELERYAKFPEAWDGYQGSIFSSYTIDSAINILKSVQSYLSSSGIKAKKVSPGPCPDGSVDLEIVVNNKIMITNISDDSKYLTIFTEDENEKNNNEKTFKIEEAPLEAHLFWLAGKDMAPLAVGSY